MTGAPAGAPLPPTALLVSVGEELLSGATVDTNASWIGTRLADFGIPVRERYTVGDDDDAIGDAVREAAEGADLVVVTGGLGPTHDDRTLDAVARTFQLPLQEDPGLVLALVERFRARGIDPLPRHNLRQARIPAGGTPLPNPRGTAPGILIRRGDARIVLLPGVPREMQAILEESVLPLLTREWAHRLRPVHHRVIYTTGIPESVLSERIEPLMERDRLAGCLLAFLPGITGVKLRLTVREGEVADPHRVLEEARALLDPVIRPFSWTGAADLAEVVGEGLRARGLSVGVAESCTGGLVARRLTEVPGASAWFRGGIVAYHNDAKVGLLQVPPALIEADGAVSGPVVRAMAEGARRSLGVEVALAVTGIAGPGGGSAAKPVGTVWQAVATGAGTVAERNVFPGDRGEIRERSAQAVLHLLHRVLEGTG